MFGKIVIFVVAATFVATVVAEDVIPIVSQEMEVLPEGKYHYSYESGDGSKVSQEGEMKGTGEEAGPVVQGKYSYQGEDGKTYSVEYTADENGFQPHGDHIPEVPAFIARALEYIKAHPYVEEKTH